MQRLLEPGAAFSKLLCCKAGKWRRERLVCSVREGLYSFFISAQDLLNVPSRPKMEVESIVKQWTDTTAVLAKRDTLFDVAWIPPLHLQTPCTDDHCIRTGAGKNSWNYHGREGFGREKVRSIGVSMQRSTKQHRGVEGRERHTASVNFGRTYKATYSISLVDL